MSLQNKQIQAAPRDLGPMARLMLQAQAQADAEAGPQAENLGAAARSLLDELPAELPCSALRAQHPQVLDRIARRRRDARDLGELFDRLLFSGPHATQGFSLAALLELSDLHRHLMATLRQRHSVWDDL